VKDGRPAPVWMYFLVRVKELGRAGQIVQLGQDEISCSLYDIL
jgi:hypothetical protein